MSEVKSAPYPPLYSCAVVRKEKKERRENHKEKTKQKEKVQERGERGEEQTCCPC